MFKHRISTALALGLTVVAAAPAAAGAQDLRSPDARNPSPGGLDLRSPDARTAGPAGRDLRTPDARDTGLGRTTAGVVIDAPRPVTVAADGIDWSDVALGAGTALPVLLAGVGGLVLVSRRPRTA
jgi:hypothetical protein